MQRSLFFLGVLTAILLAPVWGGTPTLNPSGIVTVREHDLARMVLLATDPDGHALSYNWVIEDDPTGTAYFALNDGSKVSTVTGENQARLALPRGANYPSPTYADQVIRVRADVSDGAVTVSHVWPIRVTGVNQPPVVQVDLTQMGTRENPRLSGEGIGLNASSSFDPDAGGVKFFWRIVGFTGTTCGEGVVLQGKETENPGLIAPAVPAPVSDPIRLDLEYIVEDGLYRLTGRYSGYLASINGCATGNPAPFVSASAAPAHAAYGQTVTLTGNATGSIGQHSWVQLNTTGGNQVPLSSAQSAVTTFVAPSQTGVLSFQYTATSTANLSASATVNVQVSPSGSGGSGGSTGGGGGSNPGGTSSGVATGVNQCSATGNAPALASVPETVTIEGGNVVAVSATNGRDPDNTTVVQGGIPLSGVAYLWKVVNGAGLITDADLQGAQLASVQFNTPQVAQNKTIVLSLLAADAANCGTLYTVNVVVTAAVTPNNPPVGRLNYRLEGTQQNKPTPSTPITVRAPANIILDGSSSTDSDGTVTVSFTPQINLTQGGATLKTVSAAVRRLEIQSGSQGTIAVTMTATDDRNATSSVTISFVVEDQSRIPVAAVEVMIGEEVISAGNGVEEGEVVTLSGAESRLEDGSKPSTLSYFWRQVSGPPVNLVGDTASVSRFRAPEIESADPLLTFELIVRNGEVASSPVVVEVPLQVSPLFFSQVAFGPLSNQSFRTALVLINNQDREAEEISIEFFDQQGRPLSVALDGIAWNPDSTFSLGASSSRMLQFTGADDETTTVGWARVGSDVKLTGLVLYQLVDRESSGVDSEISLFASPRGSRFTTFYNVEDGFAAAIANPSDKELRLNLKIIDEELGPNLPLQSKPLILAPHSQTARFLDTSYFGSFPDDFKSGTLVIDVVAGRAVVTVLKTKEGVAVSTLPVATRR